MGAPAQSETSGADYCRLIQFQARGKAMKYVSTLEHWALEKARKNGLLA
jgi:hypothetical protein